MRNVISLALLLSFFTPSLAVADDDSPPDDPSFLNYRKQQAGADLSLPVKSKSFPFSAIGKLEMSHNGTTGRCTGTMISRYHLLTNAHCVCVKDDCSDGKLYDSIRFLPHYYDGEYTFESEWERIWWGTPETKLDYAVIKLRSPLGDKTGWFGTSAKSFSVVSKSDWEDRLFLAGYSKHFKKGQVATFYAKCSITEDDGSAGWSHDCPSDEGSSGGAIAYVRDKEYYIAALHWGSGDTNDAGAAAPLIEWYDDLKEALKDDEPEKTTFHICNYGTTEMVHVAYAYWDKRDKDWKSRGHRPIKYKQCEEFVLPVKYGSNPVYYYAESKSHKWTGGYSFCYDDKKFFYKNAKDCGDEPPDARGFEKLDIEHDSMNVVRLK